MPETSPASNIRNIRLFNLITYKLQITIEGYPSIVELCIILTVRPKQLVKLCSDRDRINVTIKK